MKGLMLYFLPTKRMHFIRRVLMLKIYIKILLYCDWLIAMQLILNNSAKSLITVQFSDIRFRKSVTN